MSLDFNPRSHERSDRKGFYIYMDNSISIHAPTRGATRPCSEWFQTFSGFQSTLPREERLISQNSRSHAVVFQSTLPREERQERAEHERDALKKISIHAPTRGATFSLDKPKHKTILFQSTLPREERLNTSFILGYIKISIHAPTRGATITVCVIKFIRGISIHAPTRGATAILHKKFVYFYTIPTINI